MTDSVKFDEVARTLADFDGDNLDLLIIEQALGGSINPAFPETERRLFQILKSARISFGDTRFLENLQVYPGINLIKSPKGSGKTELLKRIVSTRADQRILFVGHRKALIQQACHRLDLDYYEDKNASTSRYGVSFDSILKVPLSEKYDLVIIDESEQVLNHPFARTVSDRQNTGLQALKFIAGKASTIIALDADLLWPSLTFFAGQSDESREVHLHINEFHKEIEAPLFIHDTQETLKTELFEAVNGGARCFVFSDKKQTVKNLAKQLGEESKDLRILTITSKPSSPEAIKAFLKEAQTESLKYDVILASPSISSGIDISFPDDQIEFGRVFGIFDGRNFTHYECDQQLSRVRKTNRLDVWLSKSSQPELDQTELVKKVDNAVRNSLLQDYNSDGIDILKDDHPIIEIARTNIPIRYNSQLNLRKNFVAHKEQQGWITHYVAKTKPVDLKVIAKKLCELVLKLSRNEPISELSANPRMLEQAEQLHSILVTAGLINNGESTGTPVHTETLEAFADECSAQKASLKRLFKREIPSNISKQPIKILIFFSSLIGFSNKSSLKMMNGKRKKVYYFSFE